MTTRCNSDNQFRYKLKCLSDQLTPGDLDSLKVLCRGDVNVENITSGIMLWRALQDCGKLSVNNVEYLTTLLNGIGKLHLFENIFNSTSNGVDSHNSSPTPQQGYEAKINTKETFNTGKSLYVIYIYSQNTETLLLKN